MAPLAEALYVLLGDRFVFIAYEKLDDERKRLGWSDVTEKFVKSYGDNPDECQQIIDTVGTLYFGANPHMFHCVEKRIKDGLLTYFHMERILKHGILQFFLPKYTRYYIEQRIKPSKLKNVVILACSAYLKDDLQKLHACTDRTYCFGYFPRYMDADYQSIFKKRKHQDKITILCGGRMIDCKHIDHIIRAYSIAVKSLPEDSTVMEIMGTGKLESKLRNLSKTLGMDGSIHFIGSITPEMVREKMIESDIFISASDKREGWGVVINEAMNSCCAVIASKEMGSVPFLLNDENGYRFYSGDVSGLASLIVRCVKGEQERMKKSQKAFETIRDVWNAETAAQRLIAYSEAYHIGKKTVFLTGPLSK